MEKATQGGLEPPANTAPQKPHSVVGFLFSEDSEDLIVVKKNRPQWQAGRLNGLGGKIEPGESAAAAMSREGVEEAGVNPEWSEYACVEYDDHVLHFFAARDQAAFLDARPGTDEELVRMSWNGPLFNGWLIPNLRWLIPLARHHLFYERVALAHVIMRGRGSTISRRA